MTFWKYRSHYLKHRFAQSPGSLFEKTNKNREFEKSLSFYYEAKLERSI